MANTHVSSSQWTLLPDDVLHLITNKLRNVSDYVRFGAVCKDWLSFCHKTYTEKYHLHTNQQLPLLMVPTLFHQERRGLYRITKKNMSHYQIQLHLPNKRCCGSSHGWLIFVDKFNKFGLELIVINPFLGKDGESMIKLPPIKFTSDDRFSQMGDYGVHKAILSKDPYTSPEDYEVMAIYGGYRKLAHYKSGDKFWSYQITETRQVFTDVIFHKGSIYAVDLYNWFVRVTLERYESDGGSNNDDDFSPCCLCVVTIKMELPSVRGRNYDEGHGYLVENSRGNLILVRRFARRCYWTIEDLLVRSDAEFQEYLRRLGARRDQEVVEDHQVDDEEEETDEESDSAEDEESDSDDEISSDEEVYDKPNLRVLFRVYELTMSPERKLQRLEDLCGEILFLGDNHSISVSASECSGFRPNTIYYTDDFNSFEYNVYFGLCDSGVYNVKSGQRSTKPFPPCFSLKGMKPPIFVVPRFRCNPKRILQL